MNSRELYLSKNTLADTLQVPAKYPFSYTMGLAMALMTPCLTNTRGFVAS
jgi:hypothetical protein